jgi:hypothetical protein
MSLRLNGSVVENATSGDTRPISADNFLIGGVDGWSDLFGPIYEVLMYNRTLTTYEIQNVEAYLKGKWGTP